jgi:hypothetical protein
MAGGWLLDVNVPAQLVSTLSGFGIEADTAAARGWKELTNGRLVEAAHQASFAAILTRDRRFGPDDISQTPLLRRAGSDLSVVKTGTAKISCSRGLHGKEKEETVASPK